MPLIILPNAYGDAVTNMAVDASLLYTLPTGIAAFRHYGWSEPAVTFGYTQHIREVQSAFSADLRLCRRLTGGGIVDHRNDWTYALAIQSDLAAAQSPATELYATIHKCIQAALSQQSVVSNLAPCPRLCSDTLPSTEGPNHCFVQATANDVTQPGGTKIAGAAMKRTREGLLIQGSIERGALPDDFDFQIFGPAFQGLLSQELDISIGTTEDLRTLFDGPRIQEERVRFQSEAWMNKR